MIVQNRHHPLSHQNQEVEVRREKGASEAEGSLGSPTDSRAKTSWKVLAPNYLVTNGIFPNVNSSSPNGDVNSAHWKVEEQPNKRPKKGGDKSEVASVKSVRQLGCVSQDAEPPESVTISRKGTHVSGPIQRVRFTRAALRQANIRDNRGPSLGKNKSTVLSSAVPPPWNLRTDSSRHLERGMSQRAVLTMSCQRQVTKRRRVWIRKMCDAWSLQQWALFPKSHK